MVKSLVTGLSDFGLCLTSLSLESKSASCFAVMRSTGSSNSIFSRRSFACSLVSDLIGRAVSSCSGAGSSFLKSIENLSSVLMLRLPYGFCSSSNLSDTFGGAVKKANLTNRMKKITARMLTIVNQVFKVL